MLFAEWERTIKELNERQEVLKRAERSAWQAYMNDQTAGWEQKRYVWLVLRNVDKSFNNQHDHLCDQMRATIDQRLAEMGIVSVGQWGIL